MTKPNLLPPAGKSYGVSPVSAGDGYPPAVVNKLPGGFAYPGARESKTPALWAVVRRRWLTLAAPVTVRDNTERPITCTLGTNRLVGTDPARIRDSARSVLEGGPFTPAAPPKWDGKAGERIAQVLVERYDSHLSVPSASGRDAYV